MTVVVSTTSGRVAASSTDVAVGSGFVFFIFVIVCDFLREGKGREEREKREERKENM